MTTTCRAVNQINFNETYYNTTYVSLKLIWFIACHGNVKWENVQVFQYTPITWDESSALYDYRRLMMN